MVENIKKSHILIFYIFLSVGGNNLDSESGKHLADALKVNTTLKQLE